MRREKNFDLYIINDLYKNDDVIYKYTLDSKFNLFMFNNPYSKSKVSILDINGKEIEVKVLKGKLNDLKFKNNKD